MAATRKLQGEIDRCLKKVTEGVETFEDIWQKVHNATNSNQKEKYEADLKKEIKKLQRLRDQIKSWIASGEIKDKSTLLEFRKLIETQMERFKVVERETKTKAYSKEGLGAAQKLDPAQKEKEEISSWLVSSIDALNLQVDQFESEIESLQVGKKKRLDKEKQDRMEEYKGKLEKHRFHIKKLETLLRLLDNTVVEVDQIRRIRDDIEYYIEYSQDPSFQENAYIYDDIRGLDEIELSGVGQPSSATTDDSGDSARSPASMISGASPAASPISENHNHLTDSIDSTTEKKKKEEVTKPVKPLPLRAVNNSGANNSNSNVSSLLNSSAASVNSLNNSHCAGGVSTGTGPVSSTPSKTHPPPPPPAAPSPHHHPAHHPPVTQLNFNSEVVENGPVSSTASLHPVHLHTPVPVLQQPSGKSGESSSPVSHNGPTLPPAPHLPPQHVLTRSESESSGGTATLKSMAQEAVQRAGLEPQAQQNNRRTGGMAEAHIPPLLGVAPLGPAPLHKEHQLQFQMMESAFYHMPHPSDSERTRNYLPRNVCQTPPYYNQVLMPHSDTVEFFQRLSTETLFFVFYYMEGTKAQYLAAKALKKQSWRFHTKYMMWFQRHEEPKVINEEYEQGTYIYFDYERWGQRKKEGFTFEYKYLEDRDLN